MLKSVFVKIIAGFLRLRKLLSPLRLFSFFRGLFDTISVFHQPWTIRDFSNPDFERIEPSELIEEEKLPGYRAEWYYPVRIGEVFASRYQAVGKLGFGMTSTVWLARDLKERRYIALKVYIHAYIEFDEPPELATYQRLERGPEDHPGREAIRPLLDSFIITGPAGEHHCLVHPPLWGNLQNWLEQHPTPRLSPSSLALVLRQLFLALDFAKECQVIHTDISSSNVMLGIEDTTILEKFEQAELECPTPRKEINGRFIYRSRPIQIPSSLTGVGLPILCDFGSAVWGKEKHDEDLQPDIYQSPEVILGVPWSYEVDIWNVGCLVWDLFEGGHLFHGIDKEHNGKYRSRAHLAEIISLLGLPPPDFIARGALSSKFFSSDGQFIGGIDVLPPKCWAEKETNLEAWKGKSEDRDLFLRLMSKMLQWDPQQRETAKQLLEDEWLTARRENSTVTTWSSLEE